MGHQHRYYVLAMSNGTLNLKTKNENKREKALNVKLPLNFNVKIIVNYVECR